MKHTNHRRSSIRRAVTALSVFGALAFAACESGQDVTEPVLPADELPNAEFRAAAFIMDVDTRTGDVKITPPNAEAVGELNPSIVAGDVIELTADNFFASLPGQFVPGMVRVTFDVTIFNQLSGVQLVTPTFPEPPVGTDGILLFPFETSVIQTSGGVSADGDEVIVELPSRGQVRSSTDFDGEPFNFFNDSDCLSSDNDCYRYETFGSPLLPTDITPPQTIGFDVDPTVGSFRARLIVAADLENSGGIPTGDVAGTVTSAARADLGSNVEVIVDGMTSGFITYPGGSYEVAGARAGLRSFQVSGVPAECTVVGAPSQVQVLADQSITVNVDVDCPAETGTVTGTFIRDYDSAPLQNLTVTVYPDGFGPFTELTGTDGSFSAVTPILDPPPSAGEIEITGGLPSGCTNPGQLPYGPMETVGGLTVGGTVDFGTVTIDCPDPVPGYQWEVLWAQSGSQVTATVYVDMSTFDDPYNGTDPDDIGSIGGSFGYDDTILSYVSATNVTGSLLLNASASENTSGVISWNNYNNTNPVQYATGNVGVIQFTFDVQTAGTVTQDDTSNTDVVLAAFDFTDLLSNLIINASSFAVTN